MALRECPDAHIVNYPACRCLQIGLLLLEQTFSKHKCSKLWTEGRVGLFVTSGVILQPHYQGLVSG